MSYDHLSEKERYEITIFKKQRYSNRQIGEAIGRHQTTVGRELRRNGRKAHYGAQTAQAQAADRRNVASSRVRKMKPVLIARIDHLPSNEQWPPAMISDRLELEGFESVTHETIYKYIYANQPNGGVLHTQLRRQGKQRKNRLKSPDRRARIRNRVSIDERPKMADKRVRNGALELDTVIGMRYKGALVTIVDRRTPRRWIRPVPTTGADVVAEAIIELV